MKVKSSKASQSALKQNAAAARSGEKWSKFRFGGQADCRIAKQMVRANGVIKRLEAD